MHHFNPGIPTTAARKELPDVTVGNVYKLQFFLLIIQTRPPIHFIGDFTANTSYLESKVIHPKPSSLAFRFYSF